MQINSQYCENDYIAQSNLQIQWNPYQITNGIFHRTRTTTKNSQFVWKHIRPWIKNTGVNLPDFRLYYKATVIKTVGIGTKQKYRLMEQDRKPRYKSIYLWAPYNSQRKQEYAVEKRQSLQCFWENWTATCEIMKLEHFLMPYTKISSKWIKYLNVKPETITVSDKNIGREIFDINHSKIFCLTTS